MDDTRCDEAHFFAVLFQITGALFWPCCFVLLFTHRHFGTLLYLIGHEAAHRCFTPNPTLSDWLARFAFIFSAHSRSVWAEAQNVTHHRNTNLLGRDDVVTYKLTLARFLNITRKCKLLDMERKCWVYFDCNSTS